MEVESIHVHQGRLLKQLQMWVAVGGRTIVPLRLLSRSRDHGRKANKLWDQLGDADAVDKFFTRQTLIRIH